MLLLVCQVKFEQNPKHLCHHTYHKAQTKIIQQKGVQFRKRTHTSCCDMQENHCAVPAAPHMDVHSGSPFKSLCFLFNKLLKRVVRPGCQNSLCLKLSHKHYTTLLSVNHQRVYCTLVFLPVPACLPHFLLSIQASTVAIDVNSEIQMLHVCCYSNHCSSTSVLVCIGIFFC